MSPIQAITAPDPRRQSRKFSPQDARVAADAILSGQQATDGEFYQSESSARSSGQALAGSLESLPDSGVSGPFRVRVWSEGDSGHRFAVGLRESGENADGLDPDRLTHADLDALAAENDVAEYPDDGNKKAKVAALRDAGVTTAADDGGDE